MSARCFVRPTLAIGLLLVTACATAGTAETDPVDASVVATPDAEVVKSPDASVVPTYDAAPGLPDARPIPDAYSPPDAIPLPPDAGGIICEANDECAPADCCYIVICVPGDRLGALCFPT